MDVSCVVNDIEDAIHLLTTTDCETNLKAIKTLEEASYRLWVESNTAFLDESFISVCTDEDNWLWDEECFFETKPADDVVSTDSCMTDINSSINTSVSICDESDCYFGYLGDGESSLTSTDYTDTENDRYLEKAKDVFEAEKLRNRNESSDTGLPGNVYDDNIDRTSEEVNHESENEEWVIVEDTDGKSVKAPSLPVTTQFPRKEIVPTDIVPENCNAEEYDDDNSAEEDEEDWTILSLKITEIKCVRVKHQSGIDFNVSRDSGIISPERNSSWTTTGRMSISDNFYRMHVPSR